MPIVVHFLSLSLSLSDLCRNLLTLCISSRNVVLVVLVLFPLRMNMNCSVYDQLFLQLSGNVWILVADD